jgi:hypothetical protein
VNDDHEQRPDNGPMSPDPLPAEDPDHGLDVDARFAEIIAGWEGTPPSGDLDGDLENHTDKAAADAEPAPEQPQPEQPQSERLRGLFQPSWNDPLDSEASWEDEGHFVPPPPPPLPQVEPNRRLAWAGLVGTPLIALLLVGAGIQVRGWMAFLLVVTFVGGFGYLVATMRSGPPDEWSGDDGARI